MMLSSHTFLGSARLLFPSSSVPRNTTPWRCRCIWSRVHTTISSCASLFASLVVAVLSPIICTTCLSDIICSLLPLFLLLYFKILSSFGHHYCSHHHHLQHRRRHRHRYGHLHRHCPHHRHHSIVSIPIIINATSQVVRGAQTRTR